MTKNDINDAVLAVENGQAMARGMTPGAVFHGAWHYLRIADIDVDSVYGSIFTAAFTREIRRMYPDGIPVATIRGIENTIIPE